MRVAFFSDYDDPDEWRRHLAPLVPGLDLRSWPDVGPADEVEAALVYRPPAGMLGSLPRLKGVLSLAAGVDHLLGTPDLPDVPIARMVDPTLTESMVEYVLLAVLRHHREFDHYERMQRIGHWDFRAPRPAAERTVGMLGLGTLGAAAAARLAAHGFKMLGWSRSPKSLADIECLTGEDGLSSLLQRSEILVCLLPLTPETEGLLDLDRLSLLPAGASVINVGRGPQLVEAALLRRLDGEHLSGATLDVFAREPLEKGHPFWSHPRILVTPHIASYSHARSAAPQVAENLVRLQEDRILRDLVDRKAAY